ncbi:ABC transporter permease subunit [Petroclostridium sp. X23]|uniref:ABC transporter permease n=1 Tax=Petroclostridium sp. X23 TaxID=3045146 RepID=UPI0024ACD77D|nr:ABC transporter permease subunit [Petroclostridium sp. X23]WHH59930.1 ABC transporter permease subunit [Petroclostridium sp. X23]
MHIRINPVLEKEAKTKMRGWRAPTLLSAYLLLLGGGVVLYFMLQNLNRYTAGFEPRSALNVYTTLAMFQLGLLLFITPAITSSAISGERERQTLDLLLCTRLSSWSIIFGKLMASLSHIVLLVIASIPVFSIVFLYGGLSLWDVAIIFLFQIVTAFLLGSIGIFFSSVFKKTTVATIMSYTFILILTIGTMIAFAFYTRFSYLLFQRDPTQWEAMAFLCVNPFIGLGSILDKQTGYFQTIRSMLMMRSQDISNLPWMINIAFDMVLASVLLFISAVVVNPVKGRIKKSKTNNAPVEKESEKV